jgi:hypothetical protein
MASSIGRRKFLATLGGAAAAWPLAAGAQQPAMPMVGFLRSGTLTDVLYRVAAFRERLKEAGYIDRWALLHGAGSRTGCSSNTRRSRSRTKKSAIRSVVGRRNTRDLLLCLN